MFANHWHFLIVGSGRAVHSPLFIGGMALLPVLLLILAMLLLPAVRQVLTMFGRRLGARLGRQPLAGNAWRLTAVSAALARACARFPSYFPACAGAWPLLPARQDLPLSAALSPSLADGGDGPSAKRRHP